MFRIVVDTNVFTAAVLSPTGVNRKVLRACFTAHAHPLMGAALFHEYEALLARPDLMKKSPLGPRDRQQLFEAFLSVCEWVRIYYLWRPNLPDEADNHLVELALAGGADIIVTHNVRDVRRGELAFPHLQILTPGEFLKNFTIP
ncbi:MAG: putative toxin-antitoxin system toxin component, PIN family [Chthoniobacterales bacterium]